MRYTYTSPILIYSHAVGGPPSCTAARSWSLSKYFRLFVLGPMRLCDAGAPDVSFTHFPFLSSLVGIWWSFNTDSLASNNSMTGCNLWYLPELIQVPFLRTLSMLQDILTRAKSFLSISPKKSRRSQRLVLVPNFQPVHMDKSTTSGGPTLVATSLASTDAAAPESSPLRLSSTGQSSAHDVCNQGMYETRYAQFWSGPQP